MRGQDLVEAQVAPTRSLASRALGSSAWSTVNFGFGQLMRLASNLILTRILSPEDFGLMALVTSFMIGLAMFSDMGFGPAIMQSKRGDDPEFLDTIWSLKIIRGFLIFLAALVMAWPLSIFYDAPQFVWIFPVAASSLVVGGFFPTSIESAARHLMLGRLTLIELCNQLIGVLITIAAALILKSVWALVWGNILGAFAQLIMFRLFLPGHRNSWRIDRSARLEVMKFGKWIFFSTICGFILFQGDRIVLGRVLTLDQLGIYNIGLFLGTVPMMLGSSIAARLFIPMYRQHPPGESAENVRTLARTRAGLSAALLTAAIALSWLGPILVEALYDPRYATAGGILVVIACIQMIQIIPISYEYAALAEADSKGFFVMQSSRALIYFVMVTVGAYFYGLAGLLAGQALALVFCYPVTVWLARVHKAWDPRHDLIMTVLAVGAALLSLTMHQDAIRAALMP